MQPAWRRCAAYIVCRDDSDRLLLTRIAQDGNPNSGGWTMPGGGMEWGEQPADTARREMVEETGLTVELGPILGAYSRWFEPTESTHGEAGHVLALLYDASKVTGELRTTFDPHDSTDAVAWFTLDEIRSLRRVDLVDFVLNLITSDA